MTDPRHLPDPRQLYGRWYYGSYSLPYDESEHWGTFFAGVADAIVGQLQPSTVLDAGCAKGFLVAALRERGVQASGFDVSDVAIAEAATKAKKHVRIGSLTEPIKGRFDLVTCIEVIEHLDPADAAAAVANLCGASDRILLSSTPGSLDEATHVNVQPPERWSQLFAAHGFFRDFRHDATYLSPWAALYRREDRTTTDVVVEYDRAWSQLRTETIEQRRSLLELQARCEEMQVGHEVANRLRTETSQLRKEVLRLRDAVIGKEAELGTTRGRAAELQSQLRRCEQTSDHLDAVLNSRSWRLMWAAGRPVRAVKSVRSRKAR